MTDTYATSAYPPNTAIAWATRDEIFVQYPMKSGGPPFITRFRKTADGLAQALNIIIEHAAPSPRPIPTSHPAIQRKGTGTAEQREMAAAIVRRLFK